MFAGDSKRQGDTATDKAAAPAVNCSVIVAHNRAASNMTSTQVRQGWEEERNTVVGGLPAGNPTGFHMEEGRKIR